MLCDRLGQIFFLVGFHTNTATLRQRREKKKHAHSSLKAPPTLTFAPTLTHISNSHPAPGSLKLTPRTKSSINTTSSHHHQSTPQGLTFPLYFSNPSTLNPQNLNLFVLQNPRFDPWRLHRPLQPRCRFLLLLLLPHASNLNPLRV